MKEIAKPWRRLWRVVAPVSDIVVMAVVVALDADRGQIVRSIRATVFEKRDVMNIERCALTLGSMVATFKATILTDIIIALADCLRAREVQSGGYPLSEVS